MDGMGGERDGPYTVCGPAIVQSFMPEQAGNRRNLNKVLDRRPFI